jgi:hypothetical protein
MLEELKQNGQYNIRKEIKDSIKDQEPELVKIEMQFINIGLMCITALVGIFARRLTNGVLVNTLGQP